MDSPILLATAIYSFIGLCLNSMMLFLILTHGRRIHHFLFAGFVLICAIWDLGVFLEMMRNDHIQELATYGYIITLPAFFMAALIIHFTTSYTGRPSRALIAFFWAIGAIYFVRSASGIAPPVVGTYSYAWGNVHRAAPVSAIDLAFFLPWYGGVLLACYFLCRHLTRSSSPVERRHAAYILAGFLIISVATTKVVVTMGLDAPLLLPIGMALTDLAAALIGVAIIKDRLLDITVVIKKGAIYSALGAVVLFVFSLSEHLLATYLGEFIGEESQLLHIISIGLVIAAAMPVKHRLERVVEGFFSARTVAL